MFISIFSCKVELEINYRLIFFNENNQRISERFDEHAKRRLKREFGALFMSAVVCVYINTMKRTREKLLIGSFSLFPCVSV